MISVNEPSFHPRVFGLLLRSGAELDARGPGGRAPIHMAATWRNGAALRALLAAGADPRALDARGRDPLELCRAMGWADGVAALERDALHRALPRSEPQLQPQLARAPRRRSL